MFQYSCLNPIAEIGLRNFSADYEKTDHYNRSRLCISGACAGGAAL